METGSSMLNVNLIYSQPATNSIEVSHEVLKQVVRFSCSGFALSQLDKQTPIKTNCYIFSSEMRKKNKKSMLLHNIVKIFLLEMSRILSVKHRYVRKYRLRCFHQS